MLWAEVMGWAHACPEKGEQSNGESVTPKGQSLKMPDLIADQDYVITGMFMDVGPAMVGAMGVVQVSWQEINAWLSATRQRISAWEADTIRAMSAAYVSTFNKNNGKPASPSPWLGVYDKQKAASQMKSMFDTFHKVTDD